MVKKLRQWLQKRRGIRVTGVYLGIDHMGNAVVELDTPNGNTTVIDVHHGDLGCITSHHVNLRQPSNTQELYQ